MKCYKTSSGKIKCSNRTAPSGVWRDENLCLYVKIIQRNYAFELPSMPESNKNSYFLKC